MQRIKFQRNKAQRRRILARDNFTCLYCKCTVIESDTKGCSDARKIATLDHVVAYVEIARQYTTDHEFLRAINDESNLVVACMSCNASKRHDTVESFCKRKGYDYNAIRAEILRRIGA